MNGRIVAGYIAMVLGLVLIGINAYEYVFGDGEGTPALLIIGLMLTVVGNLLARRS